VSWLLNIIKLFLVKSKIILFVFGLFYQTTFGQTDGGMVLHGKIIVDSGVMAGVTIMNLVNEKSTVSDSNGDFFILAKADDLIVFSSTNLEYYRKIIEEEDLKLAVLKIKMVSKITELEEVIVITHPEINAVALGISPKGIVHLTQMERKLYTASSTPIDALLNLMSGRTAMLKKELEVEKKLNSIKLIENMFDENYFIKNLKIPYDYINGFKYYIIDNKEFVNVIKQKNKTKIDFLMGELANKYIEIIATEK
jgi:hypothetical protein